MTDFDGADVLVTRFQGDAGEADLRLRDLLGDPETYSAQREIVDRLSRGRVLIPVVANLDEKDDAGADKRSHMATVTITDARGHKALMCFTGVDSVGSWREDARPIPVAGVEVAQAALQEGCTALLVDVAGPNRYALAGTGLWALAAGGPWRHPLDEPEVEQALATALADSGLAGRFVADPSTIDGVALVLDAPDVQRAQSLAERLGSTPAIQARVSRLEIRIEG
ncbi:MAG: SseB family protein [Candidatus Nanopelagicales bacterium]